MHDIGNLGSPNGGTTGTTSDATGINDLGQVCGYSYVFGGQLHAFLYSGGSMQDLEPAARGEPTASHKQ